MWCLVGLRQRSVACSARIRTRADTRSAPTRPEVFTRIWYEKVSVTGRRGVIGWDAIHPRRLDLPSGRAHRDRQSRATRILAGNRPALDRRHGPALARLE